MAKFKFMNVLVAAALLAGFSSCSQDDEIVAGGESANKSGNVEVSLIVPNGASTRTAEHGDGEDLGIADEYKITSAHFYFVENGTVAQVTPITIATAGSVAGNVVTYPANKISLPVGTYRVYAVANATLDDVTEKETTEAQLLEKLKKTPAAWSTESQGLMMASRNATCAYEEVVITATNSEANPAKVSISLERTVAKITLDGEGTDKYKFVYNEGGTKIADIQISSYRMINLNKSAFAFRHALSSSNFENGTMNGLYFYGNVAATNTDYVMDPYTHLKKTVDATTNTYYTTTAFADAKVLSITGATILGYCQENTMHKDHQKKGFGTAIEFEATITPTAMAAENTYTVGDDLYYYNQKFYTSYANVKSQVNDDYKATVLPDLTADNTDAVHTAMNSYNVSLFVGGKCTYTYYIKHMDNANPTQMGIMEFAVVRNNVYNVNIKSIKGLGKGITGPEVDPNEDIETTISLEVTLTVKPWIVRANDAVLGR